MGVIQADGLIKEVWNSGKPIEPDPYLKTYSWAKGLS
jgi:urea transport system substrate-binding protein